jgi:hypothetical protein
MDKLRSNQLEFWQTVRNEYNAGALDDPCFICFRSKTFETVWKTSDRSEFYNIIALAEEFVSNRKVPCIVPKLTRRLFEQSAVDGTPNKSNLGANAILGVSLAVAESAVLFDHHITERLRNIRSPITDRIEFIQYCIDKFSK